MGIFLTVAEAAKRVLDRAIPLRRNLWPASPSKPPELMTTDCYSNKNVPRKDECTIQHIRRKTVEWMRCNEMYEGEEYVSWNNWEAYKTLVFLFAWTVWTTMEVKA